MLTPGPFASGAPHLPPCAQHVDALVPPQPPAYPQQHPHLPALLGACATEPANPGTPPSARCTLAGTSDLDVAMSPPACPTSVPMSPPALRAPHCSDHGVDLPMFDLDMALEPEAMWRDATGLAEPCCSAALHCQQEAQHMALAFGALAATPTALQQQQQQRQAVAVSPLLFGRPSPSQQQLGRAFARASASPEPFPTTGAHSGGAALPPPGCSAPPPGALLAGSSPGRLGSSCMVPLSAAGGRLPSAHASIANDLCERAGAGAHAAFGAHLVGPDTGSALAAPAPAGPAAERQLPHVASSPALAGRLGHHAEWRAVTARRADNAPAACDGGSGSPKMQGGDSAAWLDDSLMDGQDGDALGDSGMAEQHLEVQRSQQQHQQRGWPPQPLRPAAAVSGAPARAASTGLLDGGGYGASAVPVPKPPILSFGGGANDQAAWEAHEPARARSPGDAAPRHVSFTRPEEAAAGGGGGAAAAASARRWHAGGGALASSGGGGGGGPSQMLPPSYHLRRQGSSSVSAVLASFSAGAGAGIGAGATGLATTGSGSLAALLDGGGALDNGYSTSWDDPYLSDEPARALLAMLSGSGGSGSGYVPRYCTNCTAMLFSSGVCGTCGHDAAGDAALLAGAAAAPRAAGPPLPPLLVYDERMRAHECRSSPHGSHPERPDRVTTIMARLEAGGLVARCARAAGREASFDELAAVHKPELIWEVQQLCARLKRAEEAAAGGGDGGAAAAAVEDGGEAGCERITDCYAVPASYSCAALAAGCAADAALAVARRRAPAAAAIIRPPGHHAEGGLAMGFCFFNNAAVAARAAQSAGCGRVLILDWDVHHGNGTQHIFDTDPSVLYMSLHRYDRGNFFPGTGGASEVGSGAGEGFTVNVPWDGPGANDADYVAAFTRVLLPIAYEYAPDLILVSAGFDAADGDPLGGCHVSPACYGHLTALLAPVAPLVLLLEGGYNLAATAASVEACMAVLTGEAPGRLQGRLAPSSVGLAGIGRALEVQSRYWHCLRHSSGAAEVTGGAGWFSPLTSGANTMGEASPMARGPSQHDGMLGRPLTTGEF